MPILNDDERAAVGTTFKQQGNAAAVALGHKLVSGAAKQTRLDAWLSFLLNNPTGMVMCWRGGQRSKIAQSWLADADCKVERVPGGYKALRQACISLLEDDALATKPWWVIAGRTGVQKTVLIQNLPNSIDLEHIAHHRGSAFGAHDTEQPALATFENNLACAYLNHHYESLVLEDESRTIGRLGLPSAWHARMQTAPLVLVEADLTTRVEHIVREYVTTPLADGRPATELKSHYHKALQRIARRLGGVLFKSIGDLIESAFANQGSHESWVHELLTQYYDPMYDYQLTKKQARIVFSGSSTEVQDYLEQHTGLAKG